MNKIKESAGPVARSLTQRLKRFLNEMPERTFIAGGCIRSFLEDTAPSDIDMFFENDLDRTQAEKVLFLKGATLVFENVNAKKFKLGNYVFDVCKRTGDYKEILNDFDFTVCQAGVLGYRFMVGEYFWEDLATKRLRFNNVHARTSLFRIQKYLNRGFKMTAEDFEIFKRNIDKFPIRSSDAKRSSDSQEVYLSDELTNTSQERSISYSSDASEANSDLLF